MTLQTATLFDAFVKAGVEPEVDSRYQAHANALFTKADAQVLRSEIKAELSEVRKDLAEMKAEMIRWTVGSMFALAALLVGVIVKLAP